jgi:hypothetical protein
VLSEIYACANRAGPPHDEKAFQPVLRRLVVA